MKSIELKNRTITVQITDFRATLSIEYTGLQTDITVWMQVKELEAVWSAIGGELKKYRKSQSLVRPKITDGIDPLGGDGTDD